MRIWYALPLVALFGCAHKEASNTEASNEYVAATKPEPAETVQAPPKAEEAAPPKVATCAPIRVHFAFDSAEIPDEAKGKLDESASCLKDNKRLRVEVEGNTDERGTEAYNYELGERRAKSVASYLEAQGVSDNQVKTISFGKDRPRCTGHDEACWMHNRVAAIAPACRL